MKQLLKVRLPDVDFDESAQASNDFDEFFLIKGILVKRSTTTGSKLGELKSKDFVYVVLK